MPYTTTGVDVFHSGSSQLRDSLRAGNVLAHKLLCVHLIHGYADSRAGAGQGVLWRISIPTLTWSRGRAGGAIAVSPTNPGISFIIDDSFLVRNYNQISINRVW